MLEVEGDNQSFEFEGGDIVPGSSTKIENKTNTIVRVRDNGAEDDITNENNNLYEGSIEEGILLKNSNVKLTDCKVTNMLEDDKSKSEIEEMSDEDAIKAVQETSPETILTNSIKINMKTKDGSTSTDIKKEVALVKNVVNKVVDIVEPGTAEKEIKTIKEVIVEQDKNVQELAIIETKTKELEVTKKEKKEELEKLEEKVTKIEKKGKAFTKGTSPEIENTQQKAVISKEYLKTIKAYKGLQAKSDLLNAEKISTESKIKNNHDLVGKGLMVIESKVDGETKEKIKGESLTIDSELAKGKVFHETCTCDFAHSFTKIGTLVGVDADFKASDVDINKCVGFVSYKEGQDVLLGAVKCAPINNACSEVNLDLSNCDIKRFHLDKFNSEKTLLSNIKDIFNSP